MDEHIVEHDYRCPACGRLNFRGYLARGSFVRMRCYRDRCRAWLLIENGTVKISESPLIVEHVDYTRNGTPILDAV